MKLTSMILATSMALVPATAAFADDAKKAELKQKKEDAKKAAIEEAKKASEAKRLAAEEAARKKKEADAAAAAAKAKGAAVVVDEAAVKAEREAHAKNLGAIERLLQIAEATSNADLKAAATRLNEKETKRHGMIAGS